MINWKWIVWWLSMNFCQNKSFSQDKWMSWICWWINQRRKDLICSNFKINQVIELHLLIIKRQKKEQRNNNYLIVYSTKIVNKKKRRTNDTNLSIDWSLRKYYDDLTDRKIIVSLSVEKSIERDGLLISAFLTDKSTGRRK